MINLLKTRDGFSAVELLVTLFVASIFLFSGYQVYLAIIKDGGEVRQQATAGSVAYNYLQDYKVSGTVAGACVPEVLEEDAIIDNQDLPDATVTVERSCPVDSSPGLNKISVTINYGENKTVQTSTYYLHPSYREPLDCPEGFIEVPGDERFGTNDFCVMKYEAKNVGGIPTSQASGSPWTSIQQYGAVNVALGKSASSSLLTNNITATDPYYSLTGNSLQYVSVDLGSSVPIYQIGVWHYWGDGRTYSGTKTEVSEDGEEWYPVFDSAIQGTYPETSAGRHHAFEIRNVRYIRDYLFGSSSNTGNHWVEITAYGPSTSSAYAVSENACSGCKLITEAEWMTIAHNVLSVPSNWTGGAVGSGSLYSGHNDSSPASALAASTNDSDGYTGTGNSSPSNQRRTLTLTNGEVIWDFAGNVWEWTQGNISVKQPGLTGDSGFSWKDYNNPSLQWGGLSPMSRPQGPVYPRSQGFGGLSSNFNATGAYGFIRGGHWSEGVSAGAFTLNMSNAQSISVANVGFRVTR